MNVNPNSADYGKIVPWDSLTDEQRQSGDWILLPTHNEDGDPAMAKRKNPFDEVFAKPDRNTSILRDLNAMVRDQERLIRSAGRARSEESDG